MSEENNLFEEFSPVSTEEWENVIERDLNGADYKQKLKWETKEGIEALPFYRREDRKKEDKTLLPADHQWSICQSIYEQDIAKANKFALNSIEGGADALRFQVEMQSVAGNIGSDMQGIAVQSQEKLSQLLNDISLEETELHFNTGMLSPIFIGLLLNKCEKRGIEAGKVTGTFGYDPFSFILDHGRLPMDEKNIEESLKQVVSACKENLQNMHPLRVDAGLFKNAGATIVQELGYALAAGSGYLAMAGKEAASAIHFNFAVSGNYFLEIAKLRAARRLWSTILQAYESDETEMIIHGTTATWNKSKTEPYTNIIRETTEAMAAAIGGCDTITVQPFDAIETTPDEFSRRIARNTQLILKEEAWFEQVTDPAAGSWYIETLTDKIAEAAWGAFQEIEQEGGLLQSIKEGTLQTAIAESKKTRMSSVENNEQIFVGVNKYIADENEGNEDVLPGKKTVSMQETEDGADVDFENLIPSIKNVLQEGAAIGDLAPALFDIGILQIEPIEKYSIE